MNDNLKNKIKKNIGDKLGKAETHHSSDGSQTTQASKAQTERHLPCLQNGQVQSLVLEKIEKYTKYGQGCQENMQEYLRLAGVEMLSG